MFSYLRHDPGKHLEPFHWAQFAAGMLVMLFLVAVGLFLGFHSV
jgi:hypothetical protein